MSNERQDQVPTSDAGRAAAARLQRRADETEAALEPHSTSPDQPRA